MCVTFQSVLLLAKQGLLQNVRFIFDTTVEDVLLSRDCEIPKQGNGGFLWWPFEGLTHHIPTYSPCVVSMLCDFFFFYDTFNG